MTSHCASVAESREINEGESALHFADRCVLRAPSLRHFPNSWWTGVRMLEISMRRLTSFAAFAAFAAALAGADAAARADAVDDELRAYDQLLKPTGDALAAIKCDSRD